MATTLQENQDADAEFGAAFSDDAPQAAASMEADGMNPDDYEAMDEAMDAGEAPPAEVVDIPVEPAAEADDTPTDPKEIQRQKSWEGRLRAREAELKAREDALRGGSGDGDGDGDDSGEPESPAEAVEDAIESVQSGEMTAEQALSSLAADFGDEFASMLGVLVRSVAKQEASSATEERVGAVKQSVEDVVAGIHDERVQRHFEAIMDKHPDFLEIAEGDAIQGYLDSLGADERVKAEETIAKGSAKAINQLLDAVKAHGAGAGEEADAAMDDAEGVRSGPVAIPAKPSQSDDFAKAWDEF